MKLIFAAAAVFLASMQLKAQINLEHTYTDLGNVFPYKVEDHGYKYMGVDSFSNDVRIYNSNHSLWKTVPTSGPGTASVAFMLSQYLFNNNPEVEVVVIYYSPSFVRILGETGNVLKEFPGASNANLYKIDGRWKLLVRYSSPNTIADPVEVYDLPGNYSGNLGMKEAGTGAPATTAYPNPFHSSAKITYELPAGQRTGTIELYNNAGQKVRSYLVTNQFNDILIERGELPAGMYIYTISGGASGKLLIQ